MLLGVYGTLILWHIWVFHTYADSRRDTLEQIDVSKLLIDQYDDVSRCIE